jgi:hypothetical protein
MLRLVLATLPIAALAACHAPPVLNAAKGDTKLRAAIDASIHPGDDPSQVQSILTDLGVKPIDQELTSDPAGPRLKAWVWGPAGPWAPSDPDAYFNWAEVLFRFDTAERLEAYDITRRSIMVGSMRYTIDARRDPQVRPQPPKE